MAAGHRGTQHALCPPWFRLPDPPPLAAPVIVGAGLAGCSLARALAERGVAVRVLEAAENVAAGASGIPVAIVKPYVTRHATRAVDFYRHAFKHLRRRLQAFDSAVSGRACGAIQLVGADYPPGEDYAVLTALQASARAGAPIGARALWFADAGWIDPRTLCRALLRHPAIELATGTTVCGASPATVGGWSLTLDTGTQLHASCLILTNGPRAIASAGRPRTGVHEDIFGITGLPLTPARGQLSRYRVAGTPPRVVVCGSRYAVPIADSVTVGASFQRSRLDADPCVSDDEENYSALRQLLPDLPVVPLPGGSHAGIRITTPDRLPLVGPVPDLGAYRRCYAALHHGRPPGAYPAAPLHAGVYTLGGLGSRGCVSAGYAAELLCRHLTGDSEALQGWADLLHPARFVVRALRRAPRSP